MRTDKKTAPSTSSDKLSLTCPAKWCELSQEQLRYTLDLIGCNLYSDVEIRTYMLFRFCNIEVLKKRPHGVSVRMKQEDGRWRYFDMQTWQIQDMIAQLSFINSPEDMDIRLEDIAGLKPVNGLLHGLAFSDYLNLETLYQGYLASKKNECLVRMAKILYRDEEDKSPETLELDTAELTGTFFWFCHVKKIFSQAFPHFFKPAKTVGGKFNVLEAANAQIRALTDGDVTKEDFIKGYDCWRCLTELDAKAREADEFKAKYGNK